MSRCATVMCAISLTIPFLAMGATCPFEQSVYEDLDGTGFRLEFGPPQVDAARIVHSATISHPKRGTVLEFDFKNAMGHGQPFLTTRDAGADEALYWIHFFDEHLRSSELEGFAEPYIFIEGLTDWYGDDIRKAREPPIGTPLWKFASCKKLPGVPGSSEKEEPTGSTESLSSAEWIAEDGRIAAYGQIKNVEEEEGRRFLGIDYGEWISEEECKRRVAANTLDMDESDCEVDSLRYVNQNPKVREFGVAGDVELVIPRPSRPIKTMTWDQFAEILRTRTDDTRELWDGLWQIRRRDKVVERIEWVYTP